jgi:hypothetical protein
MRFRTALLGLALGLALLGSTSRATPMGLRATHHDYHDHHDHRRTDDDKDDNDGGDGTDDVPGFCLSDGDVDTIVSDFINLLVHTQEDFNVGLANELLADDFADYSDSINYLEESQLGAVSFANKQEFIDGQGNQPPFPSVDTLATFHTCDRIAWRWQANTAALPIRGINMFLVNDQLQIRTIYVEFNSGAFLKNIGSPECDLANTYYN